MTALARFVAVAHHAPVPTLWANLPFQELNDVARAGVAALEALPRRGTGSAEHVPPRSNADDQGAKHVC
jgi:hypothetical protein